MNTKTGDQVFETGHVTFDRQIDKIEPGENEFATMRGAKIAKREKYNAAFNRSIADFPYLRFSEIEALKEVTENQDVMLYEFFHKLNERKIVHGYMVVYENPIVSRMFVAPMYIENSGRTEKSPFYRKFFIGPHYKSRIVVNACGNRILTKLMEEKHVDNANKKASD